MNLTSKLTDDKVTSIFVNLKHMLPYDMPIYLHQLQDDLSMLCILTAKLNTSNNTIQGVS